METKEKQKYNKFLCKAAKAGNGFVNDYKQLSPANLQKFQQVIKTSATFDIFVKIFSN